MKRGQSDFQEGVKSNERSPVQIACSFHGPPSTPGRTFVLRHAPHTPHTKVSYHETARGMTESWALQHAHAKHSGSN